jgi:D-xylose transport system permease protein
MSGAVRLAPPPTVRSHLRDYLARVRGGDIGSLPAVVGLVLLCVIFSIARPTFLTAGNFANLFAQGAQITLIAMGLVFVLLIGEIDLSAGFASGVCGAVLATVSTGWGWPWYAAVAAALLTGLVIGTLIGVLVAKVGIPSFVVTLAAFLSFQGVLLWLLDDGKVLAVGDETIIAVQSRNLSPLLGWLAVAIAVAGYAAAQLVRLRNRAARNLVSEPVGIVAARIAGLAAILAAAVLVLNRDRGVGLITLRGVPLVVPLIAALLILGTFVLQRTTYGRHVYAVGGNTEAARRAGIDVDKIRVTVFMIGAVLAAVGGIVAASRARSVDPNSGGSNVLLYAVGAAVIGGTSLFGGKGRLMDAVIGGAVVAVIDNGMGLLGYSSGTKLMITGAILLLAAMVDALSRRRAAATGTR